LGSIRLSYSDGDGNGSISQSEIIKENHYYPYGLKMRGFNSNISSLGNSLAQKYMFNGKEFDDSFNETLNTYDFGARNYDPALGRWTNLDPLAEMMRRHSPYNYAFDNPVYFIDPDGQAPRKSIIVRGAMDLEDSRQNGFGGGESGEDDPLNQVTSTENSNNSNIETDDGDKPIGKNYKGKTQTGPATPLVDKNGKPNTNAYNCHSYAWCNSLGDPKDPANQNLVKYGITKWDNDPTNNTGGYTPLQFNDPNQIGDRVIYYAWNNKSGKVGPTHSAVVMKVDQQGNTVLVESKWGEAPRYQHHPRDVPSSYGAKTPTFVAPNGKKYASRVYFRKNL
jgi:RHS repeat-associated protein